MRAVIRSFATIAVISGLVLTGTGVAVTDAQSPGGGNGQSSTETKTSPAPSGQPPATGIPLYVELGTIV